MPPHKDFSFIGRLCLDFAQTDDMGYGTRFERLKNPAELQRWLSLSSIKLPNVRIKSSDLDDARILRSAIWRVAVSIVERKNASPGDIRILNRMAREPGLVRELGPAATSVNWYRPTIGAALATISQDSVVQFGDRAQRERLRRCENPGCKVVFFDDSRPGNRRWCASNRCGDRMRAKSYRQRHR